MKDFNLSNKEWVNLKTILNGMFEYACRMKYLQENLMPKIRISVKFRQVVKKTGKTQTYNTEELENLNTYLDEKYAERFDLQVKSSHKLRKTYASMCNANGVPIDFIREQLGHAFLSTTYGYIYNPLTEAESYKMLTDALSRKKDTTPEQETDSIVSAPKPDSAVATTVNIADNVVSLEAFQSRKLTVPKMSSNVPTFSKAIK